MRKTIFLFIVMALLSATASADSKETVQVNGGTVAKFATRMTFSGDNVTLSYDDGTSQTADLSTVSIAFDYVVVFKEANHDNLEVIKTFGGRTVAVEVTRTLTAGQWGCICLPFNVPSTSLATIFGDGVKIATLNDVTEDGLCFSTSDELKKGLPYLIKPGKNVSTFTMDNAVIGTMAEGSTISAGDFTFTGNLETLSASLTGGNSSDFLVGDVNKDKLISIADVTLIVNCILSGPSSSEIDTARADVNGDNVISISDVTTLVDIILGNGAATNSPAILIDGEDSGLKVSDFSTAATANAISLWDAEP